MLSEVERLVLMALYVSDYALNTQQIHNKLLIMAASTISFEIGDRLRKKKDVIRQREGVIPTSVHVPYEKYLKDLEAAEADEDYKELLRLVKKEKNVPTYNGLRSVLKNFEKEGLVISREVEGMKAKAVWYLPPWVREQIKKSVG